MTAMPVPDLIPIAREGSGHFTALGRHAGGQHLAYVAHAYPDDHDGDHRRPGFLIATLHTFAPDGAHAETVVRPVPAGEPGPSRGAGYRIADSELARLLEPLGDRVEDRITVRPFLVSRAGFTVGLAVNTEFEYADLTHLGVRFSEPWDGGYDT